MNRTMNRVIGGGLAVLVFSAGGAMLEARHAIAQPRDAGLIDARDTRPSAARLTYLTPAMLDSAGRQSGDGSLMEEVGRYVVAKADWYSSPGFRQWLIAQPDRLRRAAPEWAASIEKQGEWDNAAAEEDLTRRLVVNAPASMCRIEFVVRGADKAVTAELARAITQLASDVERADRRRWVQGRIDRLSDIEREHTRAIAARDQQLANLIRESGLVSLDDPSPDLQHEARLLSERLIESRLLAAAAGEAEAKKQATSQVQELDAQLTRVRQAISDRAAAQWSGRAILVDRAAIAELLADVRRSMLVLKEKIQDAGPCEASAVYSVER